MLRLAFVFWSLAATVLAGAFIICVLMVPQLSNQAMLYIPVAVVAAMIVAIPIAWVVAGKVIQNR